MPSPGKIPVEVAKMAKDNDKALTLQEASDYTGLSIHSLRRKIKSGKLPGAYKEAGKTVPQWVIPKVECDRLKSKSQVSAKFSANIDGVNLLPLSYFDERRKEWEEERLRLYGDISNLKAGIQTYQYQLERIQKLLPAPAETIAYEFEKVKSDLEEKEASLQETTGKLSQVSEQLQKLESDRQELEISLQTSQEARGKVAAERDSLSSEITRIKGIQSELQGQKSKLEEELESIRRESQEKEEKLSHQVNELTTGKTQAEEKAEQLERERKILEDRLKKKEEERRDLQAELEKEKGRSWWKKLFGIK